MCVLSHFSHVWLSETLWPVAHLTALSMGLSRQEYWRGLPALPPEDLVDPGIEPCLLCLLHWQAFITGLVKKFHFFHITEKLKWTFWPTQYYLHLLNKETETHIWSHLSAVTGLPSDGRVWPTAWLQSPCSFHHMHSLSLHQAIS